MVEGKKKKGKEMEVDWLSGETVMKIIHFFSQSVAELQQEIGKLPALH